MLTDLFIFTISVINQPYSFCFGKYGLVKKRLLSYQNATFKSLGYGFRVLTSMFAMRKCLRYDSISYT